MPLTADATILVVNDRPDELERITADLDSSGFRVVSASTGEQAVLVAELQHPDLILSDEALPGLDGIELCRRLRGHPDLQHTPCILTTARPLDAQRVVQGRRAGADDYVDLPYDPMRLAAVIAQHVERGRATRALLDSEERYRLLAETATDAIITINERGAMLFANRSAERVFGFSVEEMIGQPITLLMPPEVHAAHRAGFGRYLQTGQRTINWEAVELPGRHKTGRALALELSFGVSTNSAVRVFTGVFRDISERKRAEAEARGSEERLRQVQKMEAVGRLAGGIAHDFNNLLTAITGYSDLAMSRLAPDDPLNGDLHEIHRAAEHAAVLTRQMLAFGRKQLFRPEVIDINVVVADMKRMLHPLIGEDVTLTTVPASLPALVRADRNQVEQVILNLVVNARDAMPQGGTLTIGIERGPDVALTVADTGCGIDDATLAHIFEPFFTTKEVGKGTGLGLSTVYGIVSQSGGHVSVSSVPGQGTTFRITLPSVEGAHTPQPVHVPRSADAGVGHERILLVEDDAFVRDLVRRVLTRAGYHVVSADSPAQALDIFDLHTDLDMVLTDVVMPGMTGPTLAARLKEMRPALKVMYMSGYADAIIAEKLAASDTPF
ncbi:MAG TPA: response regulator, partial [Vicinamibacterales bacterium]|nr:response regulator [Vicinamibacterales bacterium]